MMREQQPILYAAEKSIHSARSKSEGIDPQTIDIEVGRRHFLTAVLASENGFTDASKHHKKKLGPETPYSLFFDTRLDGQIQKFILAGAIVNTDHYTPNFAVEYAAAKYIEDPYLEMRVHNALRKAGNPQSADRFKELLAGHMPKVVTNAYDYSDIKTGKTAFIGSFGVVNDLRGSDGKAEGFEKELKIMKHYIGRLNLRSLDSLAADLMNEESKISTGLIDAGFPTEKLCSDIDFEAALLEIAFGKSEPQSQIAS